jgi:hypothetical protein
MAEYIFVPTGGKVQSETVLTAPLFVAAKDAQKSAKSADAQPKKTTRARKAQ